MTGRSRQRSGRRRNAPDEGPLRTCVGCRRVRPQKVLIRIVRAPDGSAEPDPRRRRGGRGAYLCAREACLAEALRRGRLTPAFRAPALLRAEALERLRSLLGRPAEPDVGRQSRRIRRGSPRAEPVEER